MFLLGAKPEGRHIEQHDIFFGIGGGVKDIIPSMYSFWPEAKGKMHIDAYREVTRVDGYAVQIIPRTQPASTVNGAKLFFLNLGGYKPNEFEEYHYKMILACPDKGQAARQAKLTAFYQHTGFRGADSHIDDKYGVDVDDLYEIEDILPTPLKQQYSIQLSSAMDDKKDEMKLGYFRLDKF